MSARIGASTASASARSPKPAPSPNPALVLEVGSESVALVKLPVSVSEVRSELPVGLGCRDSFGAAYLAQPGALHWAGPASDGVFATGHLREGHAVSTVLLGLGSEARSHAFHTRPLDAFMASTDPADLPIDECRAVFSYESSSSVHVTGNESRALALACTHRRYSFLYAFGGWARAFGDETHVEKIEVARGHAGHLVTIPGAPPDALGVVVSSHHHGHVSPGGYELTAFSMDGNRLWQLAKYRDACETALVDFAVVANGSVAVLEKTSACRESFDGNAMEFEERFLRARLRFLTSNGVELWSRSFARVPSHLAEASNADLLVTSSDARELWLDRISPRGAQRFTRRLGEQTSRIAVLKGLRDGSTFLASDGSGAPIEAFRFDAQGKLLWKVRISAPRALVSIDDAADGPAGTLLLVGSIAKETPSRERFPLLVVLDENGRRCGAR